MAQEKHYVIINTSDIDIVDFNQTSNENADNLRLNKNATKCVICYRGRQPSFFDGYKEYTHTEILALVNSETNEWYIPSSEVENGSWGVKVRDVLSRYNPFKNWL
tara:strand:- start:1842 stop:2156 length:315 start_codon:yes stop_codon:yes gene_type:complete